MTYDMGFATLSSSTSAYDRSYEGVSDNTGFFAAKGWLFYYGYGYMLRPAIAAERQNTEEAFVQELRLVSNGDQNLDWTIGAFTWIKKHQQLNKLGHGDSKNGLLLLNLRVWYGYGLYYDPSTNVTFDWSHERFYTDFAVFEITWNISDDVDLTLGARYINEDRVTSQTSFPIWGAFNPVVKNSNG